MYSSLTCRAENWKQDLNQTGNIRGLTDFGKVRNVTVMMVGYVLFKRLELNNCLKKTVLSALIFVTSFLLTSILQHGPLSKSAIP